MRKQLPLPSIGVAMIARNSRATIRQALDSVGAIATQIVVVDTGSTDATPSIAARCGAEVYFHVWQENFSHARNLALRYLRTAWALILDSDERLDVSSFFAHAHLLLEPTIGGIEVVIVNRLGGTTFAEHRYTRLFRRHPAIWFEGRIHEQIAESILCAGFEIVPSAIRIEHEGYAQASPEKIARNIALLEAELAVHPDSTWHRYHLGLTEFAAGNLERAWSLLEPLRQSPELTTEQREFATLRCAQCALARDDLLRAEELLAFTSRDTHREGLRLFVLAGVLAAQRRFATAAELLQMPAVCQSGLVEQEHRALFAQRLWDLAQQYHHCSLDRVWQDSQPWQHVFR